MKESVLINDKSNRIQFTFKVDTHTPLYYIRFSKSVNGVFDIITDEVYVENDTSYIFLPTLHEPQKRDKI